MKKLINWYKILQPYQKLLFIYFWQCLLWGFFDIGRKWFNNEEDLIVVKDMIFSGIFIGTIFTLSTDWYLIKKVFSRNKKGNKSAKALNEQTYRRY